MRAPTREAIDARLRRSVARLGDEEGGDHANFQLGSRFVARVCAACVRAKPPRLGDEEEEGAQAGAVAAERDGLRQPPLHKQLQLPRAGAHRGKDCARDAKSA